MGFGDLNSECGSNCLNSYLVDKSYIEGFVPSQADVAIFSALKSAPSAKFENALRWYNHIKSYESEFSALPGVKKSVEEYGSCLKKAEAAKPAADDDSDDLFGSSDEEVDEEAEKLRQERLEKYAQKKQAKPGVIAKSNIILEVKPWDDETDMKEMERLVREIKVDGLLWGASKLVPVGYGISKLQISCVIEDDKVSVDDLTDKITENEDYVQSVDIAAFNKV
ncbi:DgyrCDS326 [Dimorphilus gyrociliatus]|uniref:Elongation factor 1-beta n=1 Tax=Dimorphilus gyrociliatus TaxID=2664684 RepID=A0A7I8V469_9ANNE|nr:DgyrCDS326 [Dimorphilus gyrociliatus]